MDFINLNYELRIFQHGLIATRQKNWHDFFNAMVWHKFPQTKSIINSIHYQEIKLQNNSMRSRKRDLLTLFDECGVIVIADSHHLDLIRNHKWIELFIDHKNCWLNNRIKIVTFGHAMYEKYLTPYIGMTAKALLFESIKDDLDDFLAQKLNSEQILNSKSDLAPLPLLGIPHWYKNQNLEFYTNKNYFR